MRRIAALLCLCTFGVTTRGTPGPANLIANPWARTTISLNGSWRVIVDPNEAGLRGRYFENRKPKDKSDFVQYDFDSSSTLSVPGDWNSQRAELFFYEGPVWYKRSFSYHKRSNTRVFVYFGAANYQARVFLNGKKLGEHEGGFTPFNFEVTDSIIDGDNFLIVEVSNTRRRESVPGQVFDWWNYGGVTRDVALIEVPEVFIENYFVQSEKGTPPEIAGWIQVNGAKQPQQVTLQIPEAQIKQSITTDAAGHADFHFPAKLELWSPEKPKLYRVTLSSGSDTVTDDIGFRTIEVRGTQILLNGKPIFLRGISLHEEAPLRSGRSFSQEDDEILLGWARDLGCNFVRLTHYPHNEAMIRLADRLGFMVWSEIPLWQDIAWDNPATLDNAEGQMRDVIARDHNRAAVIFWSLSNETRPGAARQEFLKALGVYTRQLDSTRLITSAMNTAEKIDPNTRSLKDPLGEYLDVLGINEYIGWYEGRPEDAESTVWMAFYQKPVIVSEFGADALLGHHGDQDTRWTEEYQASLFRHQINMLRKMPNLTGISPWVLIDFRSPNRPLPGIQDFFNRKGLISTRGQKKQAFFVLREFYRDLAGSK